MFKDKVKVFVTGSAGLAGSAVCEILKSYSMHFPEIEVITDRTEEGRRLVDYMDPGALRECFAFIKPDVVVHCAGLVGGITANRANQAGFLFNNVCMGMNVVNTAFMTGVPKVVNLGSTCMYPPDGEHHWEPHYSKRPTSARLFAGPLEPTNEGYAIAKSAVARYCEYLQREQGFQAITLVPTNLYGPHDNYGEGSHAVAALIRKFHEAKKQHTAVYLLGTGKPVRQFMHAFDLARAVRLAIFRYSGPEPLDVAPHVSCTIRQLADVIQRTVDGDVEVHWDNNPDNDGARSKLYSSSRLQSLGWKPDFELDEGIEHAYVWFREKVALPLVK